MAHTPAASRLGWELPKHPRVVSFLGNKQEFCFSCPLGCWPTVLSVWGPQAHGREPLPEGLAFPRTSFLEGTALVHWLLAGIRAPAT